MRGTREHGSPACGLTTEHIDNLYNYAMALTRSRTEAEDLVQETYARALEAVGRLRENSNIKGWLFTILRNLWFDELRRRRVSNISMGDGSDVNTPETLADNRRSAHDIFVANEHAEAVHSAVNSLSPEFREIIILREFHEMSYQQIAEVLGCPAGTVMSRLGRARAKLRTLLTATWSRPAVRGVCDERVR